MIYDKKKKKEFYDINTALGDNYADYATITGERKKMTDGAEIYRGGDGRMYADKGGKTLAVRNNYKKPGIGAGANNALSAFYQSSVRRAGDGAYGGSEWDKRTRDLINRALGLSYDDYAKSDAYKALAGRYAEQGRQAMDETAAQIAARTGGVASSYAAAAGQQQYNEYMRRLEEAARAQYDKDRGDLIQNAGLAQQMGNEHYDRWLNEQRRQATERDTQMSIIREMLGNEESDLARALDAEETAYRRNRDAMDDDIIAEDRAIEAEDRNRKIADASKKAAQDEVNDIIRLGGEPPAELISASGYTPEYIAAAKSAARSTQKKQTTSTPRRRSVNDEIPDSSDIDWSKYDALAGKYGAEYVVNLLKQQKNSNKLLAAWENHLIESEYAKNNTPEKMLGKPVAEYDEAAANYQDIDASLDEAFKTQGKATVLEMLKDAYGNGLLNISDYLSLYNKYRDMK